MFTKNPDVIYFKLYYSKLYVLWFSLIHQNMHVKRIHKKIIVYQLSFSFWHNEYLLCDVHSYISAICSALIETWFALSTYTSPRSLNRLHCQQALLDKLGQWHNQQVQSGRRWTGSAGDSKEGASQRHSSGRNGWVNLVTSLSDCHRGLFKRYEQIKCLTG